MSKIDEYALKYSEECIKHDQIGKALYSEYNVKQGLRDEHGNGVLTGLTNISSVIAKKKVKGKTVPCDGELTYRGYDIKDLINGARGRGMIYEEGAFLLLFGRLPNEEEIVKFRKILVRQMKLPSNFTRDVIMKAPTADIMSSMTKSVLTLGSYDNKINDLSIPNVLRQCLNLIAIFPMLAVYGYHAYNHYENYESMYIHRPDARLSLSKNFLRMLRPDKSYSPLEAEVLDVALLVHMEHGGGNNSTFTTRVVTSSGTDTYAAIAAALSSLKGPKHGGANLMVVNMIDDIKEQVKDYSDKEQVEYYLRKILDKEAFDRKGLIYGIGHAIYSVSDPREVIFKGFVERLAKEKHQEDILELYQNIEDIAPGLIASKRKMFKGVSPNVDFYSGFVYEMLNIPRELYTPLFAVARIVGWSAHRIEELVSADKIIRPAYMELVTKQKYIEREDR